MSELWFWLWCRWTHHRGAAFDAQTYSKPGRPDYSVAVCRRCDRVTPETLLPFLDILEAELDAEEAAR